METILKIRRKLPKPIRELFSWFYRKWSSSVKWDKEMIKDLKERFNLEQREVVWLLKSGTRLNADFWKIFHPKTEEEIEKFYQDTPFYIFELAFWHMKRAQRKFRAEIVKLAEGNVLDFGGGIGDLSLGLRERKFKVDYADVSGKTFDFAKWLFHKRNLQIRMIDLKKEKISKQYDTIYCIDVIEHLNSPKRVLEDLVHHLKTGGRLIITNLELDKLLNFYPMHQKIKLGNQNYLNSLGLFKTGRSWLLIKK